jgi:hypothetical protein
MGRRNMRTGNLLGDPKIVMDTLEFVEKTGKVQLGMINGTRDQYYYWLKNAEMLD